MAEIIQQLFCDPPIAIARVGGSTTPLVAYTWAQPPSPRADGETVALPVWSLRVLPDGSADPFLPDSIPFRDGNLIRPICPFVEVWARLGEPGSNPSTWRDAPLTPALLAGFGASEASLRFTIDARNVKAARRRRNADLRYGTFPPVEIRGDQHVPVPLNGSSPPGVTRRMIPAARSIALGSVQVLRSRPQPPAGSAPWVGEVNVEVIRLRFTPGQGRFYGPRQAAQPTNASPVPAVEPANAFLDATAGWFGVSGAENPFVIPSDTFDETSAGSAISLGVVDDTCEARITVELQLQGGALGTHANIFVAPPDFGPDRRPFLSLADELNDRAADAAARSAALAGTELDEWVQDLFERAYETVSLLNVDFWRRNRGLRPLSGPRLAATPIPEDGAQPPNQAMGSQDALRNRDLRVGPTTDDTPLPVSDHARNRHRSLSDVEALRNLVLQSPDRLRQLIRAAFEVEPGETGRVTTMRMPPFMRQSNALPLTLAAWQYDLLMRWVEEVLNPPVLVAAAVPPAGLSEAAAARRDAVIRRLG